MYAIRSYYGYIYPKDELSISSSNILFELKHRGKRPEHEKRAWKALFDYYVFGPAERAGEHLPEHARGNLAPIVITSYSIHYTKLYELHIKL